MYHKFLLLTMDQMMVHMEARLLHSQNRRGENILGTLRTCILVKIEWGGKRFFSKKKKKRIYRLMGLIRDQHLCLKVHNIY